MAAQRALAAHEFVFLRIEGVRIVIGHLELAVAQDIFQVGPPFRTVLRFPKIK